MERWREIIDVEAGTEQGGRVIIDLEPETGTKQRRREVIDLDALHQEYREADKQVILPGFIPPGTMALCNNGVKETMDGNHALHDSFGILSKAMGVACIKNLERVVSVSENGSGVAVNESTHQLVDTLKIPDVGILNVMPNPAYPNMVLLYTREEGKQMKLFDVRGFIDTKYFWGWTGREPESIYLKQEWSPNGTYFTTGCRLKISFDIFDIRKNCPRQPLSVAGSSNQNNKCVFKASWSDELQLLLSISEDQMLGVHKVV